MNTQEMPSNSSSLNLQLVGDLSSRWRLETIDLSSLRHKMGDDVLRAFVRCFVHADRLTSLAHFGQMDGATKVPQVASRRNFLTAFWFAVGTLRELAIALRQLRSALAKRRLLSADVPLMQRLGEIEDRWENDPFYRSVRNTQAFHVDDQIIAKGIDTLCLHDQPIVIVEGDGTSDYYSSAALGANVLLLGFGATEQQIKTLMQMVYNDIKIYLTLDELFFAILKKIGVHLTSKPWTEDQTIWDI